jgi:transcriptional regulator with PAS, ATPase and Fis domain
MSYPVLILGESGTGKTTSLRNLNPEHCVLIQSVKKPLPFRSAGWLRYNPETKEGNVFVTDKSDTIVRIINGTSRPIVIIDDFQYIMANEFMRRVLDKESGNAAFAKYNEIARSVWDIINAAAQAGDVKRVYMLSHTQNSEDGNVKIKTIGKLLDEKITIEGMFTMVMRTSVNQGDYLFSTHNSGHDTVKTPLGMFADDYIPNDLAAVDAAIKEFYEIGDSVSLVNQAA